MGLPGSGGGPGDAQDSAVHANGALHLDHAAGTTSRLRPDRDARTCAAWAQYRRQLPAAFLTVLLCICWLGLGHPGAPLQLTRWRAQDGGSGGSSSGGVEGVFPVAGDTVHTLITSNGRPYINWQTLVLYGSYLRAQRMPGGHKMVAFTRLLHRVADDALVPGVPTFRIQPLHPECGGGGTGACKYVVAERPIAMRQFLDAAKQDPSLVKAPWLYLIESDFVFVRPVVPPGPAESAVRPLAFKYRYITPQNPGLREVMLRLYPPGLGPLTDIPSSGPSPVMARVGEWLKVAPRWEGISQQMERDDLAVQQLGWVREMYAFSVAAAVERLDLVQGRPPDSPLMVQIPAEDALGNASAIHYTWAAHLLWAANGSDAWHFEKREMVGPRAEDELPKARLPPPWQPGVWLTKSPACPSAEPTTKALYDLSVLLVETINAAVDEVGGAGWKEVLGRAAEERRRREGDAPPPGAAAAAAAAAAGW